MTENDAGRGDMSREAIRARMRAHAAKAPSPYYSPETLANIDPSIPEVIGVPPSRLRLLWWRLTNWIPTP